MCASLSLKKCISHTSSQFPVSQACMWLMEIWGNSELIIYPGAWQCFVQSPIFLAPKLGQTSSHSSTTSYMLVVNIVYAIKGNDSTVNKNIRTSSVSKYYKILTIWL